MSWKIQATRSHIPRSYHTHCQGYQGSTLMSKHWVDIRICEPDTRAGWYLLKSIWCSLVTPGRGKTSRAMKLDMERNLVGMYNFLFNEKADESQPWKDDSWTQQTLYKSQAGYLHFRAEDKRPSLLFCGTWRDIIATGKRGLQKRTREATFKSLGNYADSRNAASTNDNFKTLVLIFTLSIYLKYKIIDK